MKNLHRRALALLCVLVLVCMLLSPVHRCAGEDCVVCALLSTPVLQKVKLTD